MQAEMQQTGPLYGPPIPPGLMVDTEEEAKQIWANNPAWFRQAVEIRGHGWWLPSVTSGYNCPPWIAIGGPVVNELLARQAQGTGTVSAPPTPGGSDKRAHATDADKKRIAEREARLAERRRQQAEREAEEEARRRGQGSLFE